MGNLELWERYKKYLYVNPELGFMMDISRMKFGDDYFDKMESLINKAFKEIDALESGVIANPDENRMVGHYWLRNSALAPDPEIKNEIDKTVSSIKDFTQKVHNGEILSEKGKPFLKILVIGIGGSALGPQFAASALGSANDKMTPYFFDNTDPDGMDYILDQIGDNISETLSIVISKSGGTAETRNGMLEAKTAYERIGLKFEKHAVAVTGKGSKLDQTAKNDGWIYRFPMWDWVGGRTSEMSAVGMLPAALQGIDIDSMLKGARLCDEATRSKDILSNPSAILSLMWYHATDGYGSRDMVILPYKDRLGLFTKYLQQLIMESLGKEKDLDGKTVNQGISVYGNKGSTDQHAYIQQLREGVNNFFVTFIEVLKDRDDSSIEVEKDVTSGDYLNSFFQGTRTALYSNNRESLTITIDKIDPFSLGVLVALYERAVSLYASLININAYHQPGVEAGKKAAGVFLKLQKDTLEYLRKNSSSSYNAEDIAEAIDAPDEIEAVFKLLLHASHNVDHKIDRIEIDGEKITKSKFQFKA